MSALTRRLAELERRLAAPAPQRMAEPAPSAPAEEPLLLTEVVPPDELVLDTPLPQASNDDTPVAEDAPTSAARAIEDDAAFLNEQLPPVPEAARPLPRQRPTTRALEQWLAENGLAWLGGGALALGGILLVAFAAQQSWFTPPVQLGCAVTLALALIGLSEWMLRAADPNRLIAALLAGAGVATRYATAWGAHTLYGLIGWETAAALLIVNALLLIGLSFRHGQPLGVLAIIAALFAPALTQLMFWPPAALTLFLLAVAAAGFTLAALQRWAWVAVTTLLGLYFWFAAAIAENDVGRALALLSFASLGGVALAFRQPRADEEPGRLSWTRAHTFGPSVAIAFSSVAMLWTWGAVAPAGSGMVAAPAWVGALFVALSAAAVRARVAPPAIVAVSIAALTLGFALYLTARFTPLGADFYPFILFAAATTVVSAILAKPHRSGRILVAASGAIGAALLTAFAAASRPGWHSPATWTPLVIGAAMMFAAAWLTARSTQDARADKAADFWAGAGAALLFLFVEALFFPYLRAGAHASVALTLAAAFVWQGWRALRIGALIGAALALAHALSPALIGETLAGTMPLDHTLLVLGLAAGFLICGAYVVQRGAAHALSGETLSTAAIIIGLIAAFVSLRWLATGAAPLDDFSETALRVLALMAAGHIALPRGEQETSRIGAMRGHVLMAFGFVYAALAPGLFGNPWWGVAPAQISGPPIFGPLALAFAAPAAFLLFAANRLYERQRNPARLYAAGGGLLALVWALLEIRVAFHGLEAPSAPVGVLEGACYALLVLAGALAIAIAARLRAPRGGPFGHDLSLIMRGSAWAALIIAGFILLIARHPWWGVHTGATSDLVTGLAVLAQAGAVVLALLLGRTLSLSRDVEPARFAAAAAAILFAWSFGHAAIRWLHHFGAMDDGASLVLLEGFAHALWPLIFALLGALLTSRAPGRDTVRAYLYDLQAIWGAAVWPALGFAALGLWVLHNPWWGLAPARVDSTALSATAVTDLIIAAALSLLATRVPHINYAPWFARSARVVAAAHILVALTLFARAIFHGGAIPAEAAAGPGEMWTFSAIWALYGALLLALGAKRNDPILRWCGLILLLATTVKVFLFDMAQLSGFIRVASFLGLGAVLTLTAFFMRKQTARQT
jgi:uncharacterized membrane protein